MHVVLSQTPNSVYEEASKIQKKANEQYMLALGLGTSPEIENKGNKVPAVPADNTEDPDPDYKPEEDLDYEHEKAHPSAVKRLFDTDEDSPAKKAAAWPAKKTAKKSAKPAAAKKSAKTAAASSDKSAAKKASASYIAADGGPSDPDGGELVSMRFDVATGSLVPYS